MFGDKWLICCSVGEVKLGMWYNYGSMEVGSIVFIVVPSARKECLEL
jgi:hypothetical protein